MSTLEPRIEAIRREYGLEGSDFWQIKQNGQWVCKHAALEIIAVKAKVEWSAPQIIEADAPNLVCSMIVTGRMGDRTEWATGETNQTNYQVKGKQPAYPWAMAEKRAKDRVILKLVGIHGLVYSEDEMPSVDMQPEPANKPQQPPKNDETRAIFTALQKDMRNNQTRADLGRWWRDAECEALRRKLPNDWQQNLKSELTEYGNSLPEQEAA